MIDLNKLPFTFDSLIESLNIKKNFSLSRWGDGEWMCLLGDWAEGKNTDNHRYYPDMGERLKEILVTGGKGELLALQSLAVKDLGHLPAFNNFVNVNTWSANAEILSRNHARDKEFFKALEGRDVVLVGNGYLREVPFKVRQFVEIPLVNCWLEYDKMVIVMLLMATGNRSGDAWHLRRPRPSSAR